MKDASARWKAPHFDTGRGDFGNTQTVLIPGDEWHPLDDKPAPEYVPDHWDGVHVGYRLVGAFKTLALLPDHGARSSTGFWPQITRDPDEIAEQAPAPVRSLPTPKEIGRMEQALSWTGTYLPDAELAKVVQRVAFFRAQGKELDYAAYRLGIDFRIARKINRAGLDAIAIGLRRDGIAVF